MNPVKLPAPCRLDFRRNFHLFHRQSLEAREGKAMLFLQRFLGALLIAAIGGCSTMTSNYDYDRSVSFSGFKTYGWLPDPQKKTGDLRIDGNSLLALRIRNAVESQLTAKGYTKQSTGNSDFLVGYHVTLKKKTTAIMLNNSYGMSWRERYRYGPSGRVGGPPETYSYDEGTLILDMVDPKTRKLVWRGSATDQVSLSANREAKQEKVNEAVKQILEQFPPK